MRARLGVRHQQRPRHAGRLDGGAELANAARAEAHAGGIVPVAYEVHGISRALFERYVVSRLIDPATEFSQERSNPRMSSQSVMRRSYSNCSHLAVCT